MAVRWKKIGQLPSKDQMEKMSTKRLLSLKKKRLSHPFNMENFPRLRGWFKEEDILKEKSEYDRAYEDIKSVLSEREHIVYGDKV